MSETTLIWAAAGAGIGFLFDRAVVVRWIKREIHARVADGRETAETAPHRLSVFQLYRLGLQLLFPAVGYLAGAIFAGG